jgi:phospholipid/cholesterol/gamma-HCH transport system substrate-binding protein
VSEERPLPAPPPARGRDREVLVGLLVILGVGSVLLALFTLTDAALFRGRYIVTTVVADAGGIRRGDPVQMRGVNVGRVMQFRIVPEGVAVRLEIEGEYRIPQDSRVELRSSGLLGGMVANIVPGVETQTLRGGDVMPGVIVEGVFDQLDTLSASTAGAVERVQELLSVETVENVRAGSGEVRRLVEELRGAVAEQRDDVRSLVRSLRRSAEGLERATAGPELENTLKRVDALAARLDSVVDSLDGSSRSLAAVLGRLERGEGSLGKLTSDDALYANASEAAASLAKAANELSQLTADIRRQPRRYLKLSLF